MLDYCQSVRTEWHEHEASWIETERVYRREKLQEERMFAKALNASREQVSTTAAEASLAERFREQAHKWESETAHLSSPTQKMMHPSYQAILGMGRDHEREIVTFLLRDMQEHERAWFGALSYLTKENPIDRKDAGNMDKMIASWVRWGKEKGLL